MCVTSAWRIYSQANFFLPLAAMSLSLPAVNVASGFAASAVWLLLRLTVIVSIELAQLGMLDGRCCQTARPPVAAWSMVMS